MWIFSTAHANAISSSKAMSFSTTKIRNLPTPKTPTIFPNAKSASLRKSLSKYSSEIAPNIWRSKPPISTKRSNGTTPSSRLKRRFLTPEPPITLLHLLWSTGLLYSLLLFYLHYLKNRPPRLRNQRSRVLMTNSTKFGNITPPWTIYYRHWSCIAAKQASKK